MCIVPTNRAPKADGYWQTICVGCTFSASFGSIYFFFLSFLLSLCFPQRPFCCFVTRAPHPERKQLSYFLSCVTAGNTHLSVSPTVTSLVLVVALLYPRAEPQHLSTYRILCDNFLVDSTQQQQGRSSTKHRYARQIRGLTRAAYPSPILLPTV